MEPSRIDVRITKNTPRLGAGCFRLKTHSLSSLKTIFPADFKFSAAHGACFIHTTGKATRTLVAESNTVPARSLENSPPLDPGDEIRMLFQKRVVGGQLHHMVGLPAAGTAGGAVKLSHPIENFLAH